MPNNDEDDRKPMLADIDPPEKEPDKDKSSRRAKELSGHLEVHKQNIAEIHARHPLPLHIPFHRLSENQKQVWLARRKELDSANRAYYLAINRRCDAHRAEEAA